MCSTRRSVALIACGLLVACGGGGPDDGVVVVGDFNGTYFFAAPGGSRVSVPGYAAMEAGELIANGMGEAPASVDLWNEDGTLLAPSILPLTYTEGADNSLILYDTEGRAYTGAVSAAGDVALAANLTTGGDPMVVLAVKSSGTFDQTSLDGDYHLFHLSTTGAGVQTSAILGASFDGAGGMTNLALPAYRNQSGVVTAVAAFPTVGTYAVSPDGRLTVDGGAAMGHYMGTVLAGGSLVLLAGDTVAGNPPRLIVLLRVGTALSNATFAGDYSLAGIMFDDPTRTHFTSYFARMTADGAGAIPAISVTWNREGIVSSETGTDDYAVSPDGTLLMSDVPGAGGGPYYRGAVSSDGRFAVICGSIASGREPILGFLVRR